MLCLNLATASLALALALAVTAATAAASALPPCASDADCSYNGVCDAASGVCACDAPWTSDVDGAGALPACGFLAFAPSPVSACGPACAFHGGPSSVNTSWASWGMSVRQDGGVFHGVVAEMANGCGLGAWTRGSQVVHASAPTPLGPFTRGPAGADVVVPAWAHNPQQIRAPDGTYVIFTLGDGWPQNGPPQNCLGGDEEAAAGSAAAGSAAAPAANTHALLAAAAVRPADSREPWRGPLGQYGNCTVTGPGGCDPGPCWKCNVTVHYSATPDAAGPWTPLTVEINRLSNFDNLLNWNPAPLVLPNGSVAVMIHTDDNQGWSGESIAVADTWRGPFTVTVGNENVANLPKSQEDPFVWIDKRGHWHALVHKMFDPPGAGPCGSWAGGHLSSADGTKWSAISRAYNTTFVTADGASTAVQRRERPKLLFAADGVTPTHLYNGVISADGKQVYTAVAPLAV